MTSPLRAMVAALLLLFWRGPGGAAAAGVAAEGDPVLGPRIGRTQAEHHVTLPPLYHHIRHHQHHLRDPRPRDYQQHHQAATPSPAPCVLSPEHLVASAEAAVGKVLEGACNEKEFRDQFHNLETQLADQFNVLKTMILNLEDKIGAMDIGMEQSERRLLRQVAECGGGGGQGAEGGDEHHPAEYASRSRLAPRQGRDHDDQDEDNDADYDEHAPDPARRDGAQGPGAREEEIQRLNNTVDVEQTPRGPALGSTAAGCGAGQRVFTYFWRVRNMDYKLTGWNHRRSLRSPSFYVYPGGYRMYLRIYPRHSGENVYVHVGLTRGEYDGGLQWPFHFKHRLAVLDQVGDGDPPAQDLVSRLWDPSQLCSGYNWQRPALSSSPDNYECVGLGFPQAVLRSRSYIREDTIVLKLTVCLETP